MISERTGQNRTRNQCMVVFAKDQGQFVKELHEGIWGSNGTVLYLDCSSGLLDYIFVQMHRTIYQKE